MMKISIEKCSNEFSRISNEKYEERSSLDFIELIDYEPKYDEKYLKILRDRAKKNWLGKTNPEIWLLQVREGYEV